MRLPPRFRPGPFRAALLFASLCALSAAAPPGPRDASAAQAQRYQLKIQNHSRYQIQRLYMSSSEDENWGPDQLGERVLRPGSAHTISDILPGKYDLKLVNEDGDPCVLRDVSILKDVDWVLTNKILVKCYR